MSLAFEQLLLSYVEHREHALARPDRDAAALAHRLYSEITRAHGTQTVRMTVQRSANGLVTNASVVELDDALAYLDVISIAPLLPDRFADLDALFPRRPPRRVRPGAPGMEQFAVMRSNLLASLDTTLDLFAHAQHRTLRRYLGSRTLSHLTSHGGQSPLLEARAALERSLVHGLTYGIAPTRLVSMRATGRVHAIADRARTHLHDYAQLHAHLEKWHGARRIAALMQHLPPASPAPGALMDR